MRTITEQAGITGQVIDLHAEAWRTEPRRGGGGQAKARPACCDYCCPGCTRMDKWVNSLGGYAGTRYIALCNEAREVAGPGGQQRYLDMAQAADEEHAATRGQHLAAAIELADARSARPASRRAAEAAAEIQLAACLHRSAELQVAADELRADPRVARILDDDPDDPRLSSAEVTHRLLAAMGLAGPQPGRYEESLPPVGDLARSIGVRR